MVETPCVLSAEVHKLVEPTIDVGTLLLVDHDPTPVGSEINSQLESELQSRARDNIQALINEVWKLDFERTQDAICVSLPRSSYPLPREKILPRKREPTKWEQYAKAKGITKKRKKGKIYDEETGKWKPTYGYRSARNETKNWMIEIPDHQGNRIDVIF
ncbi:hypothetical protein AB6A40_009279 [Gnathostoma spinigerum]|uniref:Ribosome biogenesis regulatory protein n=1 Tax=Gnathostoma spinigerum TaxID=75299 RepID=A0ABD6ESR1_9BILA